MVISIFAITFILWLCSSTQGQINVDHEQEFSKVCNRIYFQRNKDSVGGYFSMPVQLIDNNIFVKTLLTLNNFPVYKAERRKLYFMLNSNTQFVFSSSLSGDREFSNLKLNGDALSITYKRWLNTANNSTFPFGRTIFVGIPQVRPRCVSQYTTSFCGHGQPIYFTANYTSGNISINNPAVDSFEPIPNLFLNYQPVYKHTNFAVSGWYLFRSYDAWYIGTNYNKSVGYLHSTDRFSRPELITERWSHWNGTNWVPYPLTNIRFQCRGRKTSCSQVDRCNNRGRCYLNSQNESVCACELGWTGPQCKEPVKQCPGFYVGHSYPMEVGTMWTETCNQGYPDHVSYMCQSNGWKHTSVEARDCEKPPTKKPTTTPWNKWTPWTNPRTRVPVATDKPWNADENKALWISVVVLALLLPLILPVIHACGYVCKIWKKYDSDGKLIEGTESDTPTCGRILSMHFYFGSILWMIFMTIGAVIHVFQYGKSTFWLLYIIGGINIGLAFLIVYMEAWFSNERKYLNEKFEGDEVTDYLNSLLDRKPTIIIKTVSYHMERRTRQVSYTDANGNTQYRTETYMERVNTHWDSCMFEYNSFQDVSDLSKMPVLDAQGVTRVKLSKEVKMADQETANALEEKRVDMLMKNKDRDTSIEVDVEYQLENFKDRLMVVDHKKGVPWWMNNSWFCFFTIIWCSWPYRIFLRAKTKQKKFHYKKEVSVKHNAFASIQGAINGPGNFGPAPSPGNLITTTNTGFAGMDPCKNVPVASAPVYPVHYQPASGVQLPVLPQYSSSNSMPNDAPPSYQATINNV